jgi:hypothetical protein
MSSHTKVPKRGATLARTYPAASITHTPDGRAKQAFVEAREEVRRHGHAGPPIVPHGSRLGSLGLHVFPPKE